MEAKILNTFLCVMANTNHLMFVSSIQIHVQNPIYTHYANTRMTKPTRETQNRRVTATAGFCDGAIRDECCQFCASVHPLSGYIIAL